MFYIQVNKFQFIDTLSSPQDAELILFSSEQSRASVPEWTFWTLNTKQQFSFHPFSGGNFG